MKVARRERAMAKRTEVILQHTIMIMHRRTQGGSLQNVEGNLNVKAKIESLLYALEERSYGTCKGEINLKHSQLAKATLFAETGLLYQSKKGFQSLWILRKVSLTHRDTINLQSQGFLL